MADKRPKRRKSFFYKRRSRYRRSRYPSIGSIDDAAKDCRIIAREFPRQLAAQRRLNKDFEDMDNGLPVDEIRHARDQLLRKALMVRMEESALAIYEAFHKDLSKLEGSEYFGKDSLSA